MDKRKNIRDIPQIKDLGDEIGNFEELRRNWPSLRSFFELCGFDVDNMEAQFPRFVEIQQAYNELAAIPDKFNDLFAEYGWVIHEDMNLEIAKAAIEKAEAGDFDSAEDILVDYYGVQTIKSALDFSRHIKGFGSRYHLLMRALEDYAAGRYHACVPVTLALTDGIVNELHENHRGFFAGGTDMTAWDSFAAHDKGLNALAKIFNKGRKKTTADMIKVPYRHGIMHGMDLGYDNKYVAAKCWAALLTVRVWAARAARADLGERPKKPAPSFDELLRRHAENEADKKLIEQWRPRALAADVDFPRSGNCSDYGAGTPERTVVQFLEYWGRKNYGYMAKMMESGGDAEPNVMRESFSDKTLLSFSIEQIEDEAPAVSNIIVNLNFEQRGNRNAKIKTFRVASFDGKGDFVARDKGGVEWKMIWWNVDYDML